jgi:hypothetical protein
VSRSALMSSARVGPSARLSSRRAPVRSADRPRIRLRGSDHRQLDAIVAEIGDGLHRLPRNVGTPYAFGLEPRIAIVRPASDTPTAHVGEQSAFQLHSGVYPQLFFQPARRARLPSQLHVTLRTLAGGLRVSDERRGLRNRGRRRSAAHCRRSQRRRRGHEGNVKASSAALRRARVCRRRSARLDTTCKPSARCRPLARAHSRPSS